eukprot:scaffold1182_cov165-Amphora_coffeaeformis.AAC.17
MNIFTGDDWKRTVTGTTAATTSANSRRRRRHYIVSSPLPWRKIRLSTRCIFLLLVVFILYVVYYNVVVIMASSRMTRRPKETNRETQHRNTTTSTTPATPLIIKCRFQIPGKCVKYESMSHQIDWFDDDSRGGPPPSTWWACRMRQAAWESDCQTTVNMDFEGPGTIITKSHENNTNSNTHNSWQILDIDGAIVSLQPIPLKEHQSCFQMSSTGATTSQQQHPKAVVTFCYPVVNIAGHPKAGTSFFHHLLIEHSQKVVPAHAHMKEYCRVPHHGRFVLSYYDYLKGFAAQTKVAGPDKILVNGCIKPEEVMELDVLLQLPHAVSVYLVRDAAARFWAAYNFWCDAKTESDCMPTNWAKPGIHHRSPQAFHDEILAIDQQRAQPKLLIPHRQGIAKVYTTAIHQFETWTASKHVHVIASEKMKTDLDSVWKTFCADVRQQTVGFDLGTHPKLKELQGARINAGNKKGENAMTGNKHQEDGLYEQSNFQPMLPETERLITLWWEECEELSRRTAWAYSCPTTAMN